MAATQATKPPNAARTIFAVIQRPRVCLSAHCACAGSPRPPPPQLQLLRRRHALQPPAKLACGAASAAAAAPDDGRHAAQHSRTGWLPEVVAPLSSPAANAKLLAICAAQALQYLAIQMHDIFLPLYLGEVLGMSNAQMGNLHAVLHAAERGAGVVSGLLTDLLSPARVFIVGMAVAAVVSKPMLALCGSVHAALGTAACVTWITCAKILDRLTKGVREAPSKALVGELAAASGDSAAAAFSVRQALSTLGMLLGSGAAGLAFQLTGRSYTATFALSVVPALLGLALVLAALGRDAAAADSARRERAMALASGELQPEAQLGLATKARALLTALPTGYWQALALTAILYLGRFDVAFVIVRAGSVMDRAKVPMLTLFSMVPVILLATPMGLRAKASVRARNTLLGVGCLMLIAGNLCYALLPSTLGMVLGCTCLGLHLAMTQGVLFGTIASYIPSHHVPGLGRISGTAWSLTDLALGVALVCANSLAGHLCDLTAQRGMGATGCFFGGAAVTAGALLVLLLLSTFGELGREPPAQAKRQA